MENKNNIENNELNKHSFLSEIKKENHFTTPNDYFEVLPQVINNKKLNNNKIKNIFDKLSYRVLAPTFGILILITTFYILQPNNASLELTNEELSEIIINEELIEFDENLVYEVYAEMENITPNEQNDNEEIIDYLIDDNISINLIIEEL